MGLKFDAFASTAYLVMALALFAEEDYEEVAARLAGTFADWDGWEESWGGVPTSGGITQARRAMDLCPRPKAYQSGMTVKLLWPARDR